MVTRLLMMTVMAPLAAIPPDSDVPRTWGQWRHWGDQGDGSYRPGG